MANIGELSVRIDADTSGLERGLRRAERSTSRMASQSGQSLRRIAMESQRAVPPVSQLTGAIGALTGALGAREVIRYADAWQGAGNQLRQVTSTTQELEAVQRDLMRVANDTRSDFTATTNLYSRLARSTKELGLSQTDLLGITQTINQSFAVSGATAEEAGAAITQLAQGLAAGALRGDEFNSVAEQAPGIMRAIADSLDMTIGNLREFAAEGGITAEIVVDALQGASDTINDEFGRSVATFGQQMTVAQNNMRQWVGTSDEVTGAIGTAGNALVSLSENMDGVIQAAEVVAGLFAGRLVGSIAASTAGMTAATAAATGLRSALAFLGGPLGLLVGAGGLLFAFREELGLVPRPAAEVEQHLDGITRATDDLNDAMLDLRVAAFGAELVQLGTQAEVLSRRMATLNRVATDPTSFGQGMQGDIQTGIAQTEQELENTQNRIEAIQQGMDRIQDLRRSDRGGDGEGGVLPGRTDTPVVSTGDGAGDGAGTEDEYDPARFMGGIGIFGEDENQAFIERLKAQLEVRQEVLREFDVLDTERQQEKFEADMERLREALELKAITEQEFRDAQLEAERNYWSKRFGITQDAESGITSLVEGFNDRRIDSYATAFDSILNSMAEHSKAAFNIQKGLALASATIDAYKAITGAYKVGASIGGPPLGAAFAAAAGAAQFATIANIASQQYSATAGGSSGGARGAASSGGGSVAGARAAQQQQSQPDQNTIVTINIAEDGMFSGRQVRGLIESINDELDNGMRLRTN